MKILYFIESLRCGGKEKLMTELINGLSVNADFSCKVVILINSLHYADQLPSNTELLLLERKGSKKDPTLFLKFKKICSDFKPDIIHVWGNMPAFYAIPASKFLRIPVINSQIADIFGISIRRPFEYFSHKLNFLFASVITSNSKAGLISYGVRNSKSKVIYNGLPLEKYIFSASPQSIKQKYNITTALSVVMVGSFSKYKDFNLFIDTAKYFQGIRPDISFIAVGEGENFEPISRRLINEKISNVILTGRIRRVEELVSVCDIGILLSPKGEGVSNAIVEYMAMGKPVIASNKGGTPEIIENGINGILLEEDNVVNLSRAIETLIDDPERRETIGNINRHIAFSNFLIQKMTEKFSDLYNSTLLSHK